MKKPRGLIGLDSLQGNPLTRLLDLANDGDLDAARELFGIVARGLETRPLQEFDPVIADWFRKVLGRVAGELGAGNESGAPPEVLLGEGYESGRPPSTAFQRAVRSLETDREDLELCRQVADALDLEAEDENPEPGDRVVWRQRFRVAVQDAAEEAGVRERRVDQATLNFQSFFPSPNRLSYGTLTRERLQDFVDDVRKFDEFVRRYLDSNADYLGGAYKRQ